MIPIEEKGYQKGSSLQAHGHTSFSLRGLTSSSKRSTRKEKRFYYIASEGLTEIKYFGYIKHSIGNSKTIDIIRLIRFDQEESKSSPLWILRAMNDYRQCVKNGTYNVYLFAGDIVQQYYTITVQYDRELMKSLSGNPEMKEMFKKRWKQLRKKLYQLEKDLIAIIKNNSELSEKGIIIDKSEATEYCRDELIKRGYSEDFCNQIREPVNRKKEDFDEKYDRFYLLFDRDKGCWDRDTPEKYNRIIKMCEEDGIEPFVSNPSFEFWLIMHNDEALKKIDDSLMKENPKEERNDVVRNYAEWVIEDLLETGYNKVMDLTPYLIDQTLSLDVAKMNAESYAQTNVELESRIGSNVNKLIKKIEEQSD